MSGIAVSNIGNQTPVSRCSWCSNALVAVINFIKRVVSKIFEALGSLFCWSDGYSSPNLPTVERLVTSADRSRVESFSELMELYGYDIERAVRDDRELVETLYRQRRNPLSGFYTMGYARFSLERLQACGLEPADSTLIIPDVDGDR